MMGKRRIVRVAVLLVLLLGCAAWGWSWLFAGLPSVDQIEQHLVAPSVRITDRSGRILYESLPEGGGRHMAVPIDQIPLSLRQATIATEDRAFYSHPGVDLAGIVRAAWINLRGGDVLVGGSTITQQVARNLLLSEQERSERTYRRKLREAYLAWQLTRSYSKDQILALYLNQTYYGGMAYGVEAAAQTFFGKSVDRLDLAESAMLAGLPQAPASYNPFTDLQAARERQEVVLSLMEAEGYISAEQHSQSSRERLVLSPTPYPIQAPHFVMMVLRELDQILASKEIIMHGGVIVRTTLDLDWQTQAERAIANQLQKLAQDRDGFGHNVNNAALVALQPVNGDVLALVGSPDYFDTEHAGAINMALSPRQPGSALKPLVYAAAFDPSRWEQPWTAATMILDVETTFVTKDGDPYIPKNYDLQEHGPVLARQALASSLNIPAVITLEHIGLPALFDLADQMGMTTLRDPASYDLSLALGGGEVRLLELTAAYATFANTGYRIDPRSILEISDPAGQILYQAPAPRHQRALDERLAWLISNILSDNDARRLGFGAYSVLRLDRPSAVKTGTTSNFHDNWTVGYTPDLVVGVWAGNTSYEPMRGVDGLSGAAPIWHQFMRAALNGVPAREFTRPPGLEQAQICALSGMLPTDACPLTRWEWFIQGTAPQQQDAIYRQVEIDQESGLLATASTPDWRRVSIVVLDLPPQVQPWARAQGLHLYSDLASQVEPQEEGEQAVVWVIAPAPGSIYVLSPGLDAGMQQLRLEAVGQPGLLEVTLYLDGNAVGRFTAPPYQFFWQLQKGEHRLWAEALLPNGERVRSREITFQVIE